MGRRNHAGIKKSFGLEKGLKESKISVQLVGKDLNTA